MIIDPLRVEEIAALHNDFERNPGRLKKFKKLLMRYLMAADSDAKKDVLTEVWRAGGATYLRFSAMILGSDVWRHSAWSSKTRKERRRRQAFLQGEPNAVKRWNATHAPYAAERVTTAWKTVPVPGSPQKFLPHSVQSRAAAVNRKLVGRSYLPQEAASKELINLQREAASNPAIAEKSKKLRPVQFTTLNRCKESPLQGRDANAGINCL